MNILNRQSSMSLVRNVLFWIGVLLYFLLTANMNFYEGYKELFEAQAIIVAIQIVVAYAILRVLIPHFLDKKKIVQFTFWMILLLIAAYALYVLYKVLYYDPAYMHTYNEASRKFAELSFTQRLFDIQVFVTKAIKFLSPTALLVMVRFYRGQQKYLKISEQKKIAELTALKNQLNPHFLFNTLNNLYSLAIKKSDRTADVIERLSDILDYILYRCNDTLVPIQNEIALINNYLELEKVRFGDRIKTTFMHDVDEHLKIAPLLLLTFIENAFTHGVTQELDQARIDISLISETDNIIFKIMNSKPKVNSLEQVGKSQIGLKNVKKQLKLLYPDKHSMTIADKKEEYTLILNLKVT